MDQLSIIFFPIPVLHTGVFLTVMRSLKPILTWAFLSSCLGSNLVPRKPRNKDSPLFLFIQRWPWKMLKGFRLATDTPFEFKPSVFRWSALSIFLSRRMSLLYMPFLSWLWNNCLHFIALLVGCLFGYCATWIIARVIFRGCTTGQSYLQ